MTNEQVIEELQYAIDTGSLRVEHEETLIKAISALKERPKGEWIPVSERVPEIGQRVIATIETLDGLQVRETIYDKYGFLCGHGIAWQPLPEPYEKGGTE